MKVIFLDIDGVLNSEDYVKRMGNVMLKYDYKIDPLAVARLNKIVNATKANIVVSSNWRIGYLNDLDALVELLRKANIEGNIIDMTPFFPGFKPRWKEIRAWLHDHPEASSFLILDDIGDMGPLSHAHIKTDYDYGLLDNHIKLGIHILNKK